MGSPLLDRLLADIKTAMKNRDQAALVPLRTLHAQVKDATLNAGREPTDEDVAAVIAKMIKQRQDAAAQFEQAARPELAAQERMEIELYRRYQPEQLDEAAIEALVREAVAATGAAGPKDMGRVMQALMPKVKGRADGKLVNQVVQRCLPRAAT